MDDNHGKAAIFDLDGTLLDSMGVWDQVDIDFLTKRYGRSMMILLTGTGRISAVSPTACCLISARLRAVCEPTRNCYALDLDSCP